jgi:hypothetical protein
VSAPRGGGGGRNREEEEWAGTGEIDGTLGPPGLKGWPVLGFPFFFFFSKLHFQTIFHFKFKSNFSNFFSRIL